MSRTLRIELQLDVEVPHEVVDGSGCTLIVEILVFVSKFALRWVMFLAVRSLALRNIVVVVVVVVNANVVVDV